MSVWSFVIPLNFVDVVGNLIDYLLTLTLNYIIILEEGKFYI